jgi:3-oxoacyl-[acyl-carrier protein] reductase
MSEKPQDSSLGWALVTGASSGIGRAVAIRLGQDGYKILVHYNSNAEGAEKTLHEVKKYTSDAQIIQFNIDDSAAVEKALKPLDVQVLVNNAGFHKDNMAVLMGYDVFESVIRTNLFGSFFVTKTCAKKMLANRQGSIVNISSLAGQIGNAGQVNYSAAKAGLIAMTKTLSRELGPRGIRVNGVAPGLIETEMTAQMTAQMEEFKKQIPMQRLGSADEVASVVSFLCSKDASYINGHTISVNGGLYPS